MLRSGPQLSNAGGFFRLGRAQPCAVVSWIQSSPPFRATTRVPGAPASWPFTWVSISFAAPLNQVRRRGEIQHPLRTALGESPAHRCSDDRQRERASAIASHPAAVRASRFLKRHQPVIAHYRGPPLPYAPANEPAGAPGHSRCKLVNNSSSRQAAKISGMHGPAAQADVLKRTASYCRPTAAGRTAPPSGCFQRRGIPCQNPPATGRHRRTKMPGPSG